MIDFHYFPNGNPVKVGIMLEETGLAHRLIRYDLPEGKHLSAEFRQINTNNKLPAIVDHDPAGGGEPFAVWESGAILEYLSEKSGGVLMPRDFQRRWEARMWLAWQISGMGPFHGQAHHFTRYAPRGEDYSVKRYTQEAKRLLNVMERRLRSHDYLAQEYSIADIACFPYAGGIEMLNGVSFDDYPAIRDWKARMDGKRAVKALLARPEFAPMTQYIAARVPMSEEQWSVMFGDKQYAASTS